MPPSIGHNSGKSAEPGQAWRRHVWAKARKDLLPTLPIEVVRMRVRRAAALGLPYKTYAGIRASSGHDLIGFMFSNNALLVLRDGQGMPDSRCAKLAGVQAARIGIAHRPVSVAHLGHQPHIDSAHAAPLFTDRWAAMRDQIKAIARANHQPADRFLMIGDTAFEHEWAEAGQTAGFLKAAQFFGANLAAPT